MEIFHFSTKDTAKLARIVLKQQFPGVKFWVWNPRGPEIRVAWVDGPSRPAVKEWVGHYSSARVDPTTDMDYSISYWLMPDGKVVDAVSSGTTFRGGYYESVPLTPKPHPLAYLVDFDAHISLHRYYTKDALEALAKKVSEDKGGWPTPEIVSGTFRGDHPCWRFKSNREERCPGYNPGQGPMLGDFYSLEVDKIPLPPQK